MKKIFILILSIVMCFALASCNFSSNSITGRDDSSWNEQLGDDGSSSEDSTLDDSGEEETQLVKVTFKQNGQADIVKTLKKGEALTDIPTPASKTGYTVAWEPIDFTNITADVTVNAIETAKTYGTIVITFLICFTQAKIFFLRRWGMAFLTSRFLQFGVII